VLARGHTQGSTLQQRTNKTLTTDPFDNTCEADEVSLEVEEGVVVGLRCLEPYMGHRSVILILNRALSAIISSLFTQYLLRR
jgi:hypothetical protein